jgi:hypothetical protein
MDASLNFRESVKTFCTKHNFDAEDTRKRLRVLDAIDKKAQADEVFRDEFYKYLAGYEGYSTIKLRELCEAFNCSYWNDLDAGNVIDTFDAVHALESMKKGNQGEIEAFRNGWQSDEFHNEIDRARNQTDAEKEKNLQWLIDKRNRNNEDLQKLENQLKQYSQQAESAKSIEELELLQTNTIRFDKYIAELLTEAEYDNLTLSTLPKERYLNTLKKAERQLVKIQKLIKSRIKFLKKRPVKNNLGKWKELHRELTENKYIERNEYVFCHAMEHHKIPGGQGKIKWLTVKPDAMYFADSFSFPIKDFNQCFLKDGKEFHAQDRSTTARKPPLPDIIARFAT